MGTGYNGGPPQTPLPLPYEDRPVEFVPPAPDPGDPTDRDGQPGIDFPLGPPDQGSGVCIPKPASLLSLRDRIEARFSYHPPTPAQVPLYEAVRASAKALALCFAESCPEGADLTVALRKLEDAVMLANKAIALQGLGWR